MLAIPHFPPEPTSIEMFLTALTNLEVLNLAHTGPDLPKDHQDCCSLVAQLHRLQQLLIEFRDPRRVGYILSHIGYPESAELTVGENLGYRLGQVGIIAELDNKLQVK